MVYRRHGGGNRTGCWQTGKWQIGNWQTQIWQIGRQPRYRDSATTARADAAAMRATASVSTASG